MSRFSMYALSSAMRRAAPLLVAGALAACAAPDATAPSAALDSHHQTATVHAQAESPAVRPSQIQDAVGDFIPSYTGPRHRDLDVVTAEVSYAAGNLRFTSYAAGPIGITPTWLYVWGVDRGAGTPRFAAIAPGVTFDLVIAINAAGATVRDLVTGVATVLPAAAVQVDGHTLTVTVPAALLPSQGRSLPHYTANLWPRSGAGGNEVIADFAPDNSMAPIWMQ